VRRAILGLLGLIALSGCGARHGATVVSPRPTASTPATATAPPGKGARRNVYAYAGPNMLSSVVARDPALVYVPNSMSNTVSVISQQTMRVIARYRVGALPQHVTPSWDLRTLYVDNDRGNSLTRIDPRTARPVGKPIRVADPYNLYFTPDGRSAIVVAEALGRLDFRDPHSFALHHSLHAGCKGVDHMDFTATGRYAVISCEFDGTMLKVDLRTRQIVARLALRRGRASPQDVKLSPDGRVAYVADQLAGVVWKVDPHRWRVIGFVSTGAGAHGLYPSRDARYLYVTNRAAGTVSVLSFRRRRVVRTWRIPGQASPDMGGVSADGHTLWLTGRYNAEVYALDTRTGRLRARVKVGNGPHGLSVWPQPGRYSLGHTGVMR
jgi:YVTN family beta-propeller protein